MRRADYDAGVQALANAGSLWGTTPEEILGVAHVSFNDYAAIPVVGNFDYASFNYGGLFYDTDRDSWKGIYRFVLTAWYDHRILLKSAFRLAKVEA